MNIMSHTFDWKTYINNYEDLKKAGINTETKALKHWNTHGKKEGRICNIIEKNDIKNINVKAKNSFDWKTYINNYEDLRNAGIDTKDKAIQHWINYGMKEGRTYKYILNLTDKLVANNEYLFNSNNVGENVDIEKITNINNEYNNLIDVNSIDFNKLNINIRNLISFNDIKNTFNKKMYYVYDKTSFYNLYPEFDYEYYRKKYFESSDISEFDVLLYYHKEGKYNKHTINNNITIIVYSLILNNNCGGILVMHNLVKLINNLNLPNIKAKLFNPHNYKYKNIFSEKFADIDEINDNTIVIYPEIIKNNPLNATKIIRWILLDLGIEMPSNYYLN